MVYATLSIDGKLRERRTAVDRIVQRAGGSAIWRSSETLERSYALLELPDLSATSEMEAAASGTAYAKPIIALALFPAIAEALPTLLGALDGPGRPVGMLSSVRRGGALIVEWDPAITAPRTVLELIDLELSRFHSAGVTELLSPLPRSLAAAIAAAGLQAPQIEPGRILEVRSDRV